MQNNSKAHEQVAMKETKLRSLVMKKMMLVSLALTTVLVFTACKVTPQPQLKTDDLARLIDALVPDWQGQGEAVVEAKFEGQKDVLATGKIDSNGNLRLELPNPVSDVLLTAVEVNSSCMPNSLSAKVSKPLMGLVIKNNKGQEGILTQLDASGYVARVYANEAVSMNCANPARSMRLEKGWNLLLINEAAESVEVLRTTQIEWSFLGFLPHAPSTPNSPELPSDPAAPSAPAPSQPKNAAPIMSSIDNQSYATHMDGKRNISLSFNVHDDQPIEQLKFSAYSSNDLIVTDEALNPYCDGAGFCVLEFRANASYAAETVITLAVSDGTETAYERFTLTLKPHLVSTIADHGTGSLRQVIANAQTGDVIEFDTKGIFANKSLIALESELRLDKAVAIIGPGADKLTLQNKFGFIFYSQDARTALAKMTLKTGEYADAAIVNTAEMFVKEVVVTGQARGIANSGKLSLHSSDIKANRNTGIYNDGELTIFDSVFANNTGEYGAGIYNHNGTLTISHSEFSSNSALGPHNLRGYTARYGGGAIYSKGNVNLQDVSISNNKSISHGAGIYMAAGTLKMDTDSIISHNTAGAQASDGFEYGGLGGGIYAESGVNLEGAIEGLNIKENISDNIYQAK